MKNSIPCVAWVSKGVAAPTPHKLQLSPEELKRLVDETKELCGQNGGNADFDEELDEEDEINETKTEDDNASDEDENIETSKIDGDSADDEDFNSRYNLDSYDNDDDQNPLFTINDLAVHVDNHDDDYITDHESEDELEEKENFTIKESDNLLVVGHVEDESAVLDVYVYNHQEDAFYVHHHIVLPAYPLALEWLDFHPSDEKSGNYVAIGDMSPVVQIWDLDVVDILEPDYTLGKVSIKKKKKIKTDDLICHSDAVLSLSWNKLVRNLLASGSADSTIVLWDLQEGKSLNHLSFHSKEVQALQWHPSESPFLLSGCTDGDLKLFDCRSLDGESKSWKVNGEIERVAWNLLDSCKFFCSTDQGYIYSIDMRNSKIEHSFQAHKKGVTGLDVSPMNPEILVSASMDKTVKLWDIKNDFQLLKSLKMKVGSIYTAKVAPDLDLTVAIGGDYSSNNLEILDLQKEIKDSESDEDFSTQNTSFETQKNQHPKKHKNKHTIFN